MRKRLLAMLLALVLLSLVGCGTTEETVATQTEVEEEEVVEEEVVEEVSYFSLGDTVSTNIAEFTLHSAEFAIALNNSMLYSSGQYSTPDDYYTPAEYDASADTRGMDVAPTGKSFVYICATIKNNDRGSSLNLEDGIFYVTYEGETSYLDIDFGATNEYDAGWEKYTSSNLLVSSGKSTTVRTSGEFSLEPDSLEDTFILMVKLPNSDGDWEEFLFEVTEDDRAAIEAEEAAAIAAWENTLEGAVANFKEESGQAYFIEHMDEYPIVSGSEMEDILLSKTWQVNYISGSGIWAGTFTFHNDGQIEDTYGYANKRTWSIDGDTLIMNGDEYYDMRLVAEDFYLLSIDGIPHTLMG